MLSFILKLLNSYYSSSNILDATMIMTRLTIRNAPVIALLTSIFFIDS